MPGDGDNIWKAIVGHVVNVFDSISQPRPSSSYPAVPVQADIEHFTDVSSGGSKSLATVDTVPSPIVVRSDSELMTQGPDLFREIERQAAKVGEESEKLAALIRKVQELHEREVLSLQVVSPSMSGRPSRGASMESSIAESSLVSEPSFAEGPRTSPSIRRWRRDLPTRTAENGQWSENCAWALPDRVSAHR